MATTLIAAVFVCLWAGESAYAAEIYRTGDSFTYEGKQFNSQITIQPNDQRLIAGTEPMIAYEYYDNAAKTAEYIYFSDTTSAEIATQALYAKFNVPSPNTYTPQATGLQTLTVTNNPPPTTPAQPQQQPPPQQQSQQTEPQPIVQPSEQNTNNSTCSVPSVGWLVCPVTSQIAAMIDGVYGVLIQFLDVKPMLQGGPIYDIWNVVRNLANICFIIAFLVIIYSQVTSLGISNYGVKKMLPRLVIAAILVNISYWICALGVDISNFLGHSVYQFLMSFATSLNSFNVEISWNSIADGILGATVAGGIAVGAGLFAVATAGSIAAALFTLIGMLISVAVAAVTALFILMARQALIVVFTIVSPLAFVALVLPKTEKWFERWKETFVAMLIMFPIFSLVFGGAVLAGAAIIAGANGNIFLMLLGKGTQLMPLAITPLIVKFSTGVLGAIAQFTNNKNKGLVDRAKNWTNAQSEYHRKKSLANTSTFGRYNLARGYARMLNNQSVRQKREMEGYDATADNIARRRPTYGRADIRAREAEGGKELTNSRLENSWQGHLRSTSGANALRNYIETQTNTEDASAGKRHVENIYNDLKKGEATEETRRRYGEATAHAMARSAFEAAERQNATNIHKNTGDQEVIKELNKQLLSDGAYTNTLGVTEHRTIYGQRLQKYATGIGNEKRMLAIEVEKGRRIEDQESGAAAELMKHFNLDASDYAALATDATKIISRTDSNNNTIDFRFDDIDARVAAIQWIAKNGSYGQKEMLSFTSSDPATNADLAGAIQRALAENSFGKMAPWANDKTNDDLSQGRITGKEAVLFHSFREIQEGRLKGESLMSANSTALSKLFSTYNDRLETNTQWDGYKRNQEAMMTREMEKDGKSQADIDTAIQAFRRDINERYTAKYYDLMLETQTILKDPQLSANINPQSKIEMQKAVGTFFSSDLGQSQAEYRSQIKEIQDRALDGPISAADQDTLDRFYQIYK